VLCSFRRDSEGALSRFRGEKVEGGLVATPAEVGGEALREAETWREGA
jgi:hypothetical protein